MHNFTYILPGRPLWAGPYPNWGFLQITLLNNCGMESSCNLYLSPEAFWNAHLHTVAGEAEFPKIGIWELLCIPMQHVDIVGATLKFVKKYT